MTEQEVAVNKLSIQLSLEADDCILWMKKVKHKGANDDLKV